MLLRNIGYRKFEYTCTSGYPNNGLVYPGSKVEISTNDDNIITINIEGNNIEV